jgi:hypothetical protein
MEIRALLSDEGRNDASLSKPSRKAPAVNVDDVISRLKQQSREDAGKALGALPKKALEQICRSVGASSADAKKSKTDVIKKILWLQFDFTAGHDVLMQQKEPEKIQ